MPERSAWLPHPLLSLMLLLIWLLLNDSLAPGHILLGAIFGLLVPLFTKRFWPERARLRRPGLAVRLAVLVVWDIVIANFAVARIVLGPAHAVQPAFVRIPLDVQGDFAQSVLLGVITLTPGTVAAQLDADRRHLLVHALSEDDPESLVRLIKARYESPIKEIFAC